MDKTVQLAELELARAGIRVYRVTDPASELYSVSGIPGHDCRPLTRQQLLDLAHLKGIQYVPGADE